MTNKLLSTVAGLACVGALALAASPAHATGIGGSVAGNGGVSGMIDSQGGATAGAGNGTASSSFGGMGQPGTDLPSSSTAAARNKTTADTSANAHVPVAKQVARETAHDQANTDYEVAQARRNAVQTQSRASVDANASSNGGVSAKGGASASGM